MRRVGEVVVAGLMAGALALTVAPAFDLVLEAMAPKTRATTSVRIGMNPQGQDTLLTTVTWTLGTDGSGPIDSLKVNTTALSGGLLVVRPPIGTVSVTVRQGIPFGDGTWDVQGQVCSYRRGKASCALSNVVRVAIVDPPPPTPTNVNLTAVPPG